MKSLFSCVIVLTFTLVLNASYAQKLQLNAIERTDGTAFFALNGKSGQLSYMLDYGEDRGTWKSYGGTIRSAGESTLLLASSEREDGTAFFSMDNASGQLYYMLDYGDGRGVWKSYGGTIGGTGTSYDFTANEREEGTAFFAQDAKSGQIYYLLDYGSNAGVWNSYGGTIGQ